MYRRFLENDSQKINNYSQVLLCTLKWLPFCTNVQQSWEKISSQKTWETNFAPKGAFSKALLYFEEQGTARCDIVLYVYDLTFSPRETHYSITIAPSTYTYCTPENKLLRKVLRGILGNEVCDFRNVLHQTRFTDGLDVTARINYGFFLSLSRNLN